MDIITWNNITWNIIMDIITWNKFQLSLKKKKISIRNGI